MARTDLLIPSVSGTTSTGVTSGALYTVPTGKRAIIKVNLSARGDGLAYYKINGTRGGLAGGKIDNISAHNSDTLNLPTGTTFQLEVNAGLGGECAASATGYLYDV